MKNFITGSLITIVFAYALMSAFGLVIGLVSKVDYNHRPERHENYCEQAPINLEKAFPAYKLGCWLGEREEN